MRTPLAEKLTGVRDFRKILETTVKELGETYSCELSQIVLSNPLDRNSTSICEYRLDPDTDFSGAPHTTFPLHLQGGGLGMVSLARANPPLSPEEVNYITVTLNELSTIIRHAQINDIVQRDTFRETFLVEINNFMNYSLGIGDALFMVVNILGEALKASRCLFICVDDSHADWKCYEYWHQGRVKSCQDYGWPTTDSPIVARSLLARTPVIVYEGAENSHLTPVQDELSLLDARSLMAVPLRSENSTHGCVIVQQCDSRRAWTRGEIDLIQRVADTVAEALAKLPEEKRAREPIMRLHQRTVLEGKDGDKKESMQSVRRALKGALGAQAIPTAQKTGQHTKPVAAAAPPPTQPAPAPPATPAPPAPPTAATPTAAQVDFAPAPPAVPASGQAATAPVGPSGFEGEVLEPDQGLNALLGAVRGLGSPVDNSAPAEPIFELDPTPGAGIQSSPPATGDTASGATPPSATPAPTAEATAPPPVHDAFGAPLEPTPPKSSSPWGDLDSIGAPGGNGVTAPAADATPAPPPATAGESAAAAAEAASKWGNLDAIGSPGADNGAAAAAASAPAGAAAAGAPADGGGSWGNLDAIQTPAAAAGGLSGTMRGGARAAKSGGPSALAAAFHKDKSRFEQPKPTVVEGPPIQIDDAQAKQKIEQVLASASNPTSDYIFAIKDVGTRILGRIDAWVAQVEAKDKYLTSHALAVAELAVAMCNMMGMSDEEVDAMRLAAVCHDIGKLAIPAATLQKPEDELTDQELITIMKHSIDGKGMVKGIAELEHLGDIILAHHEEFDGNGYPQGLKGEEIPLAARIINIASSYHAMISPLKYKPAMSAPEAQQALRAASGKAFDPSLVEILLAAASQVQVGAAR